MLAPGPWVIGTKSWQLHFLSLVICG